MSVWSRVSQTDHCPHEHGSVASISCQAMSGRPQARRLSWPARQLSHCPLPSAHVSCCCSCPSCSFDRSSITDQLNLKERGPLKTLLRGPARLKLGALSTRVHPPRSEARCFPLDAEPFVEDPVNSDGDEDAPFVPESPANTPPDYPSDEELLPDGHEAPMPPPPDVPGSDEELLPEPDEPRDAQGRFRFRPRRAKDQPNQRDIDVALLQLRRNLGHPDNRELARLLRSAGATPAAIESTDRVKCETCLQSKKPVLPRPAKWRAAECFNMCSSPTTPVECSLPC